MKMYLVLLECECVWYFSVYSKIVVFLMLILILKYNSIITLYL